MTWSAMALTCGDDWPEHTMKKRVTSVTLRTSITVTSAAFFSSANSATFRAVARVAPAALERRGAGSGVFTGLRARAALAFAFGAVLRFVTLPPLLFSRGAAKRPAPSKRSQYTGDTAVLP